jgi:predicted nucleic acid-binding protein
MKPILLDTGVIVALLDKDEWAHEICAHAIERLQTPFLTCEPVITESCYLLRHTPNAIDRIFANLEIGIFQLAFDLNRSASKVRSLLYKYADTPADFADACLIQMADEQNTGEILTLDSDFKHYRWRRNKPFHLLIPLEKR